MKAKLSLIIAGAAAVSVPMQAQVAFDGDYSQNFNTLASSGSSNPWANELNLDGWYSSRASYIANAGTSTTGGLHSYGTLNSSERALGSLASGTTGVVGFGVRLQNTSGVTLEDIAVTYTGEQWRNNGNATQQSLTFWYSVGSGLDSLDLQVDAGWTAFAGLNFAGPVATATASALDGNASANQAELSATLSGVSLAPNQELFLRWKDINDTGNDHGLAIDNFNVTGITVVPEPSTWVLLGGGLLFLANRMRRRN